MAPADQHRTRYEFFASAPRGIEELLADELRELGAGDVALRRSGVSFVGDLELAYRVCLWSRLASRVLLPLHTWEAPTPDELYRGIRAVDWSQHLDVDGTFAVHFVSVRSDITHTHFGALKVKDAVVDQFRDATGRRPSIDVHQPSVRLYVYLHNNSATVSLDLSGESLHKRHYRDQGVQGDAPLKENLAAALLLRAGWPAVAREGGPLVDPLCGTGTLLIEGAMMAGDVAPGLLRLYYGFLGWRQHNEALWDALLEEARQRRRRGCVSLPPMYGWDADPRAVRLAEQNLRRAGFFGRVLVERRDVADLAPLPQETPPGLIITNPPYGERLGDEDKLEPLYVLLGERMSRDFAGWKAAVFTGNLELAHRLGLRAHRYYSLYNGAIPARLFLFDLDGSAPRPTRPPVSTLAPEGFGGNGPAGVNAAGRSMGAAGLGPGAEMFANRLRKNQRHLGRWARREGVTCYRVYDADLPEYAVAIDRYEEWVHVQEYQAPKTIDADLAAARLADVVAMVPAILEVDPGRVVVKVRSRQRGAEQYRRQGDAGTTVEVYEGGLRFLVNLTDYLDTGLFLDHRLVRARIRELARGKRFLNLFAYTGAASVYAAAGGALATTSVDLSRTYLDRAADNLVLNGFATAEEGGEHRLVRADCVEWLATQGSLPPAERPRYGLILLDPPTFSNSKSMEGVLDVQHDHAQLIRAAADLLDDAGVLLFSTNSRRFVLDEAALPGLAVDEITRATVPPDFARNPRVHRCWSITWGSRRDAREPGLGGVDRPVSIL
jgi:23S rRNA (guanine2445-N2)-methyltransferase / 23S rRNA (guanine2069-N7)-methyltransferase